MHIIKIPKDKPVSMSEPNEKAKHSSRAKPRGGNKYPFPERLFDLLEDIDARKKPQLAHIISWHPTNGKYFTLHDRDAFEKLIQNKYFNQSKFASFRRQLNLWGFERVYDNEIYGEGSKKYGGTFFHPMFQRHDRSLCCTMKRSKLFHQGRDNSSEEKNKEEPNPKQHGGQVEVSSSSSILGSMPNEQDLLVSTFLSNVAEFKLLQNQEASSVSKVTPEEEEEVSIDISTNEDEENSWSPFLQDEFIQKKKQEQPHEENGISTCYDDDCKMTIEPLPYYDGYETSESISQQLKSVEEEMGGSDKRSFKNLIEFLSVSDENIIKFLFGNEEEEHHQEE